MTSARQPGGDLASDPRRAEDDEDPQSAEAAEPGADVTGAAGDVVTGTDPQAESGDGAGAAGSVGVAEAEDLPEVEEDATTGTGGTDGDGRGGGGRRRARGPGGEGSAKSPGPFRRLYRGQTSFDFVGRRKWWFTLSAVIIVAGLLSLGIRGFNLGIEFKGGTSWQVQVSGVSTAQATDAVTRAGLTEPVVEILGGRTLEVQADLNNLSTAAQKAETARVTAALAGLSHKTPNQVSITTVGPTWGSQITQKAIIAVIVFFIAIALYISFRFEWKMAVAAIIAVIHDLLITAGVYSLVGLQVTPDTVIAILTILGYSLYDTVVVFDRIHDNSRGLGASGRMTYSDMVNLSMNQTLARSVNTSLVAILPVFAVLVVGAQILGATTLQEFGLALLIGLISGAYSSIFIASPVLAMMKEREQRYVTIRQRLDSRGDRLGILTPTAAAAFAGGGSGGRGPARSDRPPGAIRPGSGATKKAAARSGTAAGRRSSPGRPVASGELFGDPLLVRTSNGMIPTSRALELIGPVRELLRQSEDLLRPRGQFVPAEASGSLVLISTDYVSLLLMPPLTREIERTAPHVQINAKAVDHEQLKYLFESGHVDIGVGYAVNPPGEMRIRHAFEENLVCIARADIRPYRAGLRSSSLREPASADSPGRHALRRFVGTGIERPWSRGAHWRRRS